MFNGASDFADAILASSGRTVAEWQQEGLRKNAEKQKKAQAETALTTLGRQRTQIEELRSA